jgi:hypothetical protein
MGTAYVAMLTAFYVDNGPHLPLWDRLPTVAFWLLPSAIGAPIIARAVTHAGAPPRGPSPAKAHKVSSTRRRQANRPRRDLNDGLFRFGTVPYEGKEANG